MIVALLKLFKADVIFLPRSARTILKTSCQNLPSVVNFCSLRTFEGNKCMLSKSLNVHKMYCSLDIVVKDKHREMPVLWDGKTALQYIFNTCYWK